MKIYVGCDHRGIKLKQSIINYLKEEGIEVIDTIHQNNIEDDYPDFAFEVGENVVKENALGILICGNGIGVSIAANKVKGVRCARVNDIIDTKKAREHNECNIIALASTIPFSLVKEIINIFLTSETKINSRHIKRVDKIIAYENGKYNEL